MKQGDILSPILFIIFINDLPKFISDLKETDPVVLQSLYINSLLWDGGIILISESALGSQNCIDRLSEYSRNWGLEINIKKQNL